VAPLWLFLTVLSLFCVTRPGETRDKVLRFMAQTMCFHTGKAFSGSERWMTSSGEIYPKAS